MSNSWQFLDVHVFASTSHSSTNNCLTYVFVLGLEIKSETGVRHTYYLIDGACIEFVSQVLK